MRILYSSEFLVMVPFITIAMVGTVLRGVSWCMAFVILARGDGHIYIITEALSDISMLAMSIGGYMLWGLTGLGAAYAAWYVLYTAIVMVVYLRYGYRVVWSIFILGAAILSLSAAQLFLPLWLSIPMAAASCAVSLLVFMGKLGRQKKLRR